jgi:hypothetical protein
MGLLDEGPDMNMVKEAALQGHARASSPRRVPSNDATGRVLPITPEEQTKKPGPLPRSSIRCWPCLMRTPRVHGRKPCEISTHTVPIANSSKVSIDHGAVDPA